MKDDLASPLPPQRLVTLLGGPPDTRVKKNTQLVFFERGQGGGRLPIPSINTAILLTCFLILKVNMHSVLSPGTLPRPVREIGLLEAK